MQRVARFDHPEVREVVPSHHCAALEDSHVTRWPPAWAVNDRRTELWAVNDELAFPLELGGTPGRYVATTCLAR